MEDFQELKNETEIKGNRMKKLYNNCITYCFIIAGCYFLFKSMGYGENWKPCSASEISYLSRCKGYCTPELLDKYRKEFEFHSLNALRTYNDAKDRCWWLPNISHREKARYCFTSAIAAIGSPTPQTKLVATITNLLMNYGLDVMDEWNYINNKLYWSAYHFEMCDHYSSILDKGNR